MANSNRRQQYRTSGPQDSPLEVQLRIRGDTVEAQLGDVSGWGARLLFPPGRDPKLAENRRVVLQFMQPKANLFMGTAAEVRNRSEGATGVSYGFEFVDLTRLHRFVPSELRHYFNRRRAFRVKPERETPVAVLTALDGRSLTTRLLDLSDEGFGVRLGPDEAAEFAGVQRLPLFLSLPEPVACAAAVVRVVYAGADGHPNRAGFAFHGRRGGPSQPARDRVHDYAMTLQRITLQKKSD